MEKHNVEKKLDEEVEHLVGATNRSSKGPRVQFKALTVDGRSRSPSPISSTHARHSLPGDYSRGQSTPTNPPVRQQTPPTSRKGPPTQQTPPSSRKGVLSQQQTPPTIRKGPTNQHLATPIAKVNTSGGGTGNNMAATGGNVSGSSTNQMASSASRGSSASSQPVHTSSGVSINTQGSNGRTAHDSPRHTPSAQLERANQSPFRSLSPRHASQSSSTGDHTGSISHDGDSADTPHNTGGGGGGSNTTPGLASLGVGGLVDSPARNIVDPLRASPGLTPQRSKSESKLFNPSSANQNAGKMSKRETLKVEKQRYRSEKKRAARELLSTLKDPSVVVMADWLKVRGTLKSWTRLWCVLKPGLFLLYKSHKAKSAHWVGTILLNTVELIERPSKKDGFCFKLFHPLEQSIWATKGPKGENFGAITQPLPYSYCIFRAPSEQAGKCWMDALELALRCSGLLIKTMTQDKRASHELDNDPETSSLNEGDSFLTPMRSQLNESDCERHFEGYGLEDDTKADDHTDKDEEDKNHTDSETEQSDDPSEETFDDKLQPTETPYVMNQEEELGQQGDACQTEEVADENKSIIWTLVKQVRPGMDLSKVVLPTFILEPRSFLDKLSDYYYHGDLLAQAASKEDPYSRMVDVVRWYLSGFYKKPKGLKKPYNPIIGETFRCYWRHPTGARTFYIAEQISHHPPVSAFYITNRQEGFSISGSILMKSKFYGNSLSAILDGEGRLTFLRRGEDYVVTMPYAHCKGILIGTLTMEYGGKVAITCEKTGYRAELEFKLKPFLGIGEASNKVVGKIKLGNETLATVDGKWDQEIYLKNKATGKSELLWNPTPEVKSRRLKRFTVPVDAQVENESERMWRHVTAALKEGEDEKATAEKFVLEDKQRNEAKERKAKMEEWIPHYFERNELTTEWEYKFKDLRPWDPMNDVIQYEHDYVIATHTRHRTPIVRATSIMNMESNPLNDRRTSGAHMKHSPMDRMRVSRLKRASMKRTIDRDSESSLPEGNVAVSRGSESSDSGGLDLAGITEVGKSSSNCGTSSTHQSKVSSTALTRALQPLVDLQKENNQTMSAIQMQLRRLNSSRDENSSSHWLPQNRDLFIIGLVLAIQFVVMWLYK